MDNAQTDRLDTRADVPDLLMCSNSQQQGPALLRKRDRPGDVDMSGAQSEQHQDLGVGEMPPMQPILTRRPTLEALEAILTNRASDDGSYDDLLQSVNLQIQPPLQSRDSLPRSGISNVSASLDSQVASYGLAVAQSNQGKDPSHPFPWHQLMGELSEWQPGVTNAGKEQPSSQLASPSQQSQLHSGGLKAAFRSVGGGWEAGPDSPKKGPFTQPRFPHRISVTSSCGSPVTSRHGTPRHSLTDTPRQSLYANAPRPSDTASECDDSPFVLRANSFTSVTTGSTSGAVRGSRFSSITSGTNSRLSSISDDHGTLHDLSQLHLIAPKSNSLGLGVRDDDSRKGALFESIRSRSLSSNSLRLKIAAAAAKQMLIRGDSIRSLQSLPGDSEDQVLKDPHRLSARSLPVMDAMEIDDQLINNQPGPRQSSIPRQSRGSITSADDSGMTSDTPLLPDDIWDDDDGEQPEQSSEGAKGKRPRRRYAEQQERLASLESKASELAEIGAGIEAQISSVQKEVNRLKGREMELLAIERVFASERRSLQAKLDTKLKTDQVKS